jgi:mannose/cellobiose epimerase-like protein (N-acyl-D-glucosamine 2-epimerase family)
VEPGHHYEWVWLLRRFESASGRSMQRYVDALYAHADRHGFDEAGLIVDELLIDGSHHKRSRRIWPIAGAIRANLVEARRGRAESSAKAASLAVLLRSTDARTVCVELVEPAAGGIGRQEALAVIPPGRRDR